MSVNTLVEAKRRYLDLPIEPFTLDLGCEPATLYLRIKGSPFDSQCVECPFPNCIKSLPFAEKNIIRRSRLIYQIYQERDAGKNLKTICSTYNIDVRFVRKCLNKREQIKILLDKWRDILADETASKSLIKV